MEIQTIKQRFGIIGNNIYLNRALEKAVQVAPTDISVLVMGESGVGKESIPKIIHQLSHRKHKQYIAVNCGAIPEGTIESELFGHEKGSFTGADKLRKGYFEVADGGTIFLDEVGELPLTAQVRLLRVLESGEFMKVGSSNIQKTNVRIVAATNKNMLKAIDKGTFREDLYYRLNTVQIDMPPLRERAEDIPLLFRKMANDFSEKYRMPSIHLTEDAVNYIKSFYWPGNIRQLRNFVEQVTVVEQNRELNLEKIKEYLKEVNTALLPITGDESKKSDYANEREILYKFLLDMKKDLNDLKALNLEFFQDKKDNFTPTEENLFRKVYPTQADMNISEGSPLLYYQDVKNQHKFPQNIVDYNYEEENFNRDNNTESLSLQKKEEELIKRALDKFNGKRKKAAKELGISERTLYRKIRQYGIEM